MAHVEQKDPVAQSSTSGIPKSPLYSTSSSSESTGTTSFAIIELESRDEVNPVAKEEGRGDEEVFEVIQLVLLPSLVDSLHLPQQQHSPAQRPVKIQKVESSCSPRPGLRSAFQDKYLGLEADKPIPAERREGPSEQSGLAAGGIARGMGGHRGDTAMRE